MHLGGFKQGQLATARELAAAAHPGRELLELQILEIEQHHGLEIANRLAGHGEGAIAAAQEAIGDRRGHAASHQQLQVRAAGGPAQAAAGQAREETQAIAAAGQAQFQSLAARIEGDAPLEINVVSGALAAQGEVEGDGLVLQLQGAALKGQGLVAQAAVLQLQFAPEPGPGTAQPVAPGGGQPAPERGWQGSCQGQQGQGQLAEAEAALPILERPLEPGDEGLLAQGPVHGLVPQPEVAPGLQVDREAGGAGAAQGEVGIDQGLQVGQG